VSRPLALRKYFCVPNLKRLRSKFDESTSVKFQQICFSRFCTKIELFGHRQNI